MVGQDGGLDKSVEIELMLGSVHTYLLTQTIALSLGPQVSTKGVVTPAGSTTWAKLTGADNRVRKTKEAFMSDGLMDLDNVCKWGDLQNPTRVYVDCPCLRDRCGVVFPVLA